MLAGCDVAHLLQELPHDQEVTLFVKLHLDNHFNYQVSQQVHGAQEEP